jgi:hypothetical protein
MHRDSTGNRLTRASSDGAARMSGGRGLIESMIAVAFALLAAGASSGEPGVAGDLDHWEVSTALEIGIFGYTGKGNSSSTELTGPRVSNPRVNTDLGTLIADPERSREEVLSALVGGTFEVMTPRLFDAPTQPRLFLDVTISSVLAAEVGLARASNPGGMSLPPDRNPGQIVGEASIVGRGTAITVQPQGPQIHAGFGPALTFDVGEDRIRIKPSVVYTRSIQDVRAITNRAVRLNDVNGANAVLERDFRLIELSDNLTEVYHGVGPALEVEYETGQHIGPVRITVYLKGHASYTFGDLETEFQQTNPDPESPNETARWAYKQDRWAYRGATGIRLRWDPLLDW